MRAAGMGRTVATLVLGAYVVLALGAALGLWAEHSEQLVTSVHAPPSADHWLGGNALGQDILLRALAAAWPTLLFAAVVAVLALCLGVVLGAIAASAPGGWRDRFVAWLAAIFDALPVYLLVAALAAVLGFGTLALMLMVAASLWTDVMRATRLELLALRQQEHILSSWIAAVPSWRVWRDHLLPSLWPSLRNQALLALIAAVKIHALLAFLGWMAPESAGWGAMIADSVGAVLAGHPREFLVTAVLLTGLIACLQFLLDGPRTRRRASAA